MQMLALFILIEVNYVPPFLQKTIVDIGFLNLKWLPNPSNAILNSLGVALKENLTEETHNTYYYPFFNSFDFIFNSGQILLFCIAFAISYGIIVLICRTKSQKCKEFFLKIKAGYEWSGIIGVITLINFELLFNALINFSYSV
jgi:hypothetical protein